jgi:hypothetical protein
MSTSVRREKLEFSQSMLRELRDFAASERDTLLAYLVEMAYVEVSDLLREDHASVAGHKASEDVAA